jgi:hypothetical protein
MLVLVDSSIWIRYFLRPDGAADELDALLQAGGVATCAPIRAEVVSGARTEREFARLRDLFGALRQLEPPGDVWPRLEAARFALARAGHQVALVDLMIALTAAHHRVPLWSDDADFGPIGRALPLERYRVSG